MESIVNFLRRVAKVLYEEINADGRVKPGNELIEACAVQERGFPNGVVAHDGEFQLDWFGILVLHLYYKNLRPNNSDNTFCTILLKSM
jgi:hypothetical protein